MTDISRQKDQVGRVRGSNQRIDRNSIDRKIKFEESLSVVMLPKVK